MKIKGKDVATENSQEKLIGMYTALSLGVELDIGKDSDVAEILKHMAPNGWGENRYPPPARLIPDHPLFRTSCWEYMLNCDSYCFNFTTNMELTWDHIANDYYLSGTCNLKNYNDEIGSFLDWINPYIHPSNCGFIGWTMYEEDLAPTLIMRRSQGKDEMPKLYMVPTEDLVEEMTS